MSTIHSQSWSWREAATYLAFPLLVLVMGTTSPLMLILTPIALIPTGILYWYYNTVALNTPHRVTGEDLGYVYLIFGMLGAIVVVLVQTILSYASAYLILYPDTTIYLEEMQRSEAQVTNGHDPALIEKRAKLARKPKYWVFMASFAFLIPGLTEELLKCLSFPLAQKYILTNTNNNQDHHITINGQQNEHAIIPIIAAATLGFSTIENIAFLYVAAVTDAEPPLRLIQSTCERVFFSAPGHTLTGLLQGINIITYSRTHPTIADIFSTTMITAVIALPVFFHGLFDFVLFSASALNGNVGWIHPRVGRTVLFMYVFIVGLTGILAAIVRFRWVEHHISI